MTPEQTIALTSHIIDNPPPISPKIYRAIRDSAEDDIVAWSEKWLSPPDAEQVRARVELIDDLEQQLSQLVDEGITAITESDKRYPAVWLEKLAGKAPPVIFVFGNSDLLQSQCIAVIGSRDVDEMGRQFAIEVAEEAVRNGFSVCSGGAKGVDAVAMRAAYDAGGQSVGILSDSLLKAVRNSQSLDCERICLVTPYAPSAGFSVGNAMGRNKLIYALSEAAVVVSSAANTGGTWAGATEALSQSLCTVLVSVGDDAPQGNIELSRLGAVPLSSPDGLIEAISSSKQTRLL